MLLLPFFKIAGVLLIALALLGALLAYFLWGCRTLRHPQSSPLKCAGVLASFSLMALAFLGISGGWFGLGLARACPLSVAERALAWFGFVGSLLLSLFWLGLDQAERRHRRRKASSSPSQG